MDTSEKIITEFYIIKMTALPSFTTTVRYGLQWTQQPAKNMYPYIKERSKTMEEYKEQIALYNIFHHENSYLSMTDEREVRFCLNCRIYYRPTFAMKDVNINLCQECFRTNCIVRS
jgi:ribosomal protein S14